MRIVVRVTRTAGWGAGRGKRSRSPPPASACEPAAAPVTTRLFFREPEQALAESAVLLAGERGPRC